ncbi:MAG: thioredoxin domain-containing protein [Chloroflexi bacterium]|nr:thioredoxin domain-containing protein [Chloroflexota bacterium]MBP8057042.1 thioredoxin domain-containing protein [Chloroflexota bacterium]
MKKSYGLGILGAIFLLLILVACGGAEMAENVANIESETAAAGGTLAIEEASLDTDESGLTVGFTAAGRPFRGNPDAPVVIEEYSDYQCPFCARFYQQTLPSLTQNQITNGEAVLVFYDFPLESIHPQAASAAVAARCAGNEGAAAYWNMHDMLFDRFGEWANTSAGQYFLSYAGEIGLDVDAFNECLQSGSKEPLIRADLDLGVSVGVTGTPGFFVNGQFINGAQPVAVFDQAIAAVQTGQPIAGANTAAVAQPTALPAVAPTPASFAADYAFAVGDENAPITIVEFTDYQCPYCSQYSTQTFPQMKANLIDSGRVRYILKDLPLDSIHPLARTGAVAARCAGEQDAYLLMHDQIFANQATWTASGTIEGAKETFIGYAQSLDLDAESFASCLNSGQFDDAIQANVNEAAALRVSSTPSFFVDGYPIAGARPYDLFLYAVDLAEKGELAQAYVAEAQQEQTAPTGPLDITIEEDDIVLGNRDAPVVMVEFTDYQCPYCYRHAIQTLPQLMSNYIETGEVVYVIKDFPLTSIHPQAVAAAEAAHCAQEQDAYLAMHEKLFTTQEAWSGRSDVDAIFTTYAEELGMDSEGFAECLASDRYYEVIANDLQQGQNWGITGTPGFFLNGYLISGAQPYEVFSQAIEQVKAEANTIEQ